MYLDVVFETVSLKFTAALHIVRFILNMEELSVQNTSQSAHKYLKYVFISLAF